MTTYENRYNHCGHCLTRSHSLFPCDNCILMMYCSEECQREAEHKYHLSECSVSSRICVPDEMLKDLLYIVIRALYTVGITNLSSYYRYATTTETERIIENPRTRGFVDGIFDSQSFDSVCSLLSQLEFFAPGQLMMEYAWTSLSIARLLDLQVDLPQFIQTAGLILHLMYCFQNNNSTIGESIVPFDNNTVPILPMLTRTIVPVYALISHDCAENTYPIHYQRKTVVRVNRPILKGYQITGCYGPPTSRTSRNERLDFLMKKHFFLCKCDCCTYDLPILDKTFYCITDDQVSMELKNMIIEDFKSSTTIHEMVQRIPTHEQYVREVDELMSKRLPLIKRLFYKNEFLDFRFCAIHTCYQMWLYSQGNLYVKLKPC